MNAAIMEICEKCYQPLKRASQLNPGGFSMPPVIQPPVADPSLLWNCLACTLVNEPTAVKCEACDTKRDQAPSAFYA
jgi:hypothetical protein